MDSKVPCVHATHATRQLNCPSPLAFYYSSDPRPGMYSRFIPGIIEARDTPVTITTSFFPFPSSKHQERPNPLNYTQYPYNPHLSSNQAKTHGARQHLDLIIRRKSKEQREFRPIPRLLVPDNVLLCEARRRGVLLFGQIHLDPRASFLVADQIRTSKRGTQFRKGTPKGWSHLISSLRTQRLQTEWYFRPRVSPFFFLGYYRIGRFTREDRREECE